MYKRYYSFLAGALLLSSCYNAPELSIEEIHSALESAGERFLSSTMSKPWQGEEFVAGSVGGVWQATISGDPKSFNLLVAERDASTTSIVSYLYDNLIDYDYSKRVWYPRAASYKVIDDTKNNSVRVEYTLRGDLYWSYIDGTKLPVTSDDVIYWYDEIQGDSALGSSAYSSHFTINSKGDKLPITIEKIDDKSFAFNFPVLEADPLLATNMNFGPMREFKEAKDKGGVKGVQELFNVSCDIKSLPSMGPYFISEYIPAQRIVYKRNKDYWEKDSKGEAATYPESMYLRIVSDQNTQYLLFKQGLNELYSPKPEELSELVANKKDAYSVFNAKGALGAMLWSFNQNPINDTAYQRWFSIKEFREAMSCLLNRDRIIVSVYRGLAEPKYDFFPEYNTYYNSAITLKYRYSRAMARELLSSAGFTWDSKGSCYDREGVMVEYDLSVPSGVSIANDIAQIIASDCKALGITIHVRQVDFQKLVEDLTSTYSWQSLIIGLGTNLFPTQGSNVWPSDGNLHLWYPLQESPATQWEARIDALYNEGKACRDRARAQAIWDEYQSILLEECPVIYLVRPKSFIAINNRWDLSNFYFDNMAGARTEHVYLRAP